MIAYIHTPHTHCIHTHSHAHAVIFVPNIAEVSISVNKEKKILVLPFSHYYKIIKCNEVLTCKVIHNNVKWIKKTNKAMSVA